MQINHLINYLEDIAPLVLQETYDNSGLLVGNRSDEISAVLNQFDVTEEVIDEAKTLGANLILAHHPIIFGELKKLNGTNYVERTLISAIKNEIAIYAAHTNLDNVLHHGVNSKICELLELKNCKVLQPLKSQLTKLVVFVPNDHAEKVRNVLFNAGAGKIGNYDACSFNSQGEGTFRAGESAHPFVGQINVIHQEPETRIETIIPTYITSKAVKAMLEAHPYEEVAYDLIPLQNEWVHAGSGLIGELEIPMDAQGFLQKVKITMKTGCIRHTQLLQKPIKKVAVCGGSGSFLLNHVIKAGADVFISSDFKYHQFFDADKNIVIADIGHFESEQFTKELFYELVTRKFSTFAVHLSKINTNPIKYL